MPELPDVVNYVNALNHLLMGTKINKISIKSPFLLFAPPIEEIESQSLHEFSRIGKRIVWHTHGGYRLIFHLMIAGRFHWKPDKVKLPSSKMDLAAFQFDHGTMMLTEASKKKRASLHLVSPDDSLLQFDRGGLEVLECSFEQFRDRLQSQNRTLKRALTDPTILSGIGNADSDEILLAAGLSPLKRTMQLSIEETNKLFEATRSTLQFWIQRLTAENAESFPEKVRAFRPLMAAHGKFNQPCPNCQTPIQRIRYADNECNYCSRCQTGGKLLADRSLSRLLKDDWPRTIDELED